MDRAGLDEIRDYTARECLTDAEWSALLALAYEAVAAQERIDNWKREFEKVQAKRDVYRERAERLARERTTLLDALRNQGFLQNTTTGKVWHAHDCPASFDFAQCNYRCRVARLALEGRE